MRYKKRKTKQKQKNSSCKKKKLIEQLDANTQFNIHIIALAAHKIRGRYCHKRPAFCIASNTRFFFKALVACARIEFMQWSNFESMFERCRKDLRLTPQGFSEIMQDPQFVYNILMKTTALLTLIDQASNGLIKSHCFIKTISQNGKTVNKNLCFLWTTTKSSDS